MKAFSAFGILASCLISEVHCGWSSSLTPSPAPSTDCTSEATWKTSEHGLTCSDIAAIEPIVKETLDICHAFSNSNYEGKSVYEACCTCGGSDKTLVAPSSMPSRSVYPTSVPSNLPTTTPTLKPSNLRSASPSMKPSISLSPSTSNNPSVYPTAFPSKSNVPTRKQSQTPTIIPSEKPSSKPTFTPTNHPTTFPSAHPSMCEDEKDWTFSDSNGCAVVESIVRSQSHNIDFDFCDFIKDIITNGKNVIEACCICGGANHIPIAPSNIPSHSTRPSIQPSKKPSQMPSQLPSASPSSSPSVSPSASPSGKPSSGPTVSPSLYPSGSPSANPSSSPSGMPSAVPSGSPSTVPSSSPSVSPSVSPSASPSVSPSASPSSSPSVSPSASPSGNPSFGPSDTPSQSPSSFYDTGSFVCKDNSSFVYSFSLDTAQRSCWNIGTNVKRRKKFCVFDAVRRNCPITCGLCCEDDSTFSFMTDRVGIKNCKWIANSAKRIQKYCDKRRKGVVIKSACPVACNSCNDTV